MVSYFAHSYGNNTIIRNCKCGKNWEYIFKGFSQGCKFYNNYIDGNWPHGNVIRYGIRLVGSNNEIYNNYIKVLAYGIAVMDNSYYNEIYNNTFYAPGEYGIIIHGRYNEIYNNTLNEFIIWGSHNRFYNNSVVADFTPYWSTEIKGTNNTIIFNLFNNTDTLTYYAGQSNLSYNEFYYIPHEALVIASEHLNYYKNNIFRWNRIGVSWAESSNSCIENSPITDSTLYDYYIGNGKFGCAVNTNFTNFRKIHLGKDGTFRYKDNPSTNIWLKTYSSSDVNITRKILNWTVYEVKWVENTSMDTTINYTLEGLIPFY